MHVRYFPSIFLFPECLNLLANLASLLTIESNHLSETAVWSEILAGLPKFDDFRNNIIKDALAKWHAHSGLYLTSIETVLTLLLREIMTWTDHG